MSKIDKLIEELCPNGVEYKKLKEISEMKRGTTITKKEVFEGEIPVISGGKAPAYYCDKHNRIGETITVAGSGAGAGYVQFWTTPIFVCDAFSIKGLEGINTKYLYHCLLNVQEKIYTTKKGSGVPHVYISSIEDFKIPVPPIEIQNEIVRILDNFTELETELEAELEARTKQYEYYRNKLLDFSTGSVGVPRIDKMLAEMCPNGVSFLNLKEISKVLIGEFVHKNKQNPKGIYPVYNGGITETGYYDNFNRDGNQIIISARGANAGYVNRVDKPFWSGNSCYTVTLNKDFNWVFYFYYLRAYQSNLIDSQQTGGIPAVSKKQVESFPVPVPPIEIQNEIVKILDNFSEYTSSISQGLPAEIAARRKQYEYYRNKLLTF